MKILTSLLLLALVGCSKKEDPALRSAPSGQHVIRAEYSGTDWPASQATDIGLGRVMLNQSRLSFIPAVPAIYRTVARTWNPASGPVTLLLAYRDTAASLTFQAHMQCPPMGLRTPMSTFRLAVYVDDVLQSVQNIGIDGTGHANSSYAMDTRNLVK